MSKRILVSVRAILLSWSIMPAAAAQAPIFRELGPEYVGIAAHQHSTDADFDQDGDVDLAVLAYGATGATVRLYRNDGTGRYASSGTPAAVPLALDVYGMTSGDSDGDGKPDVILSTRSALGTTDIDFYLFTPAGFVFTPGFYVGPGCSICSLQIVANDFDGDGLVDLVVNDFVGAPRHFRNNPGLVFSLVGGAMPLLSQPLSIVAAGDQDGDGDHDVFVFELFTSARVLTNSGGVFSAGPTFFAPPVPAYWSFGVGDFDGDGVRDIAVSPSGGGGVESLVSFAGGAPAVLAAANRTGDASVVGGLDIDGDGLDEVVMKSALEVRIEPRSTGPRLKTLVVDSDPVRIFDVDRDGDRDLFVNDATGARVLRVRGDGTLTDASHLPPLDFGYYAAGVALADVDGDGIRDLVAPSYVFDPLTGGATTVRRSVAWNDGRGRFATGVSTASPTTFLGNGYSVAADLDGDGVEDLAEAGAGKLLVSVSDGTGGFAHSELGLPGTPSLPTGIAASDLDLDGDVDLVIARGSPQNDVLVVFNQGTSGFVFVALSAGTANIVDCVTADVDQNGFDDIVVASFPAASSTLFFNAGGLFTPSTPFGSVAGVSVAAGDVDASGSVDLMIGDVVYLNTAGLFSTGPSTPASSPIRYSAKRRLVDFDGDGMADLLAEDGVRRAVGGGSFGPTEPLAIDLVSSAGAFVWQMDDIDRDGDKDLVALNGQIRWNSTVQIAAGSTASLGRTFRLEIYGPPGGQYDLFGSFAAAGSGVHVPGWGLLGIDQNSAFYVTSGTFDGAGAAVVVFQAPAGVAFEGLNLYWQAALPNLSRLTGALQTTLLRF